MQSGVSRVARYVLRITYIVRDIQLRLCLPRILYVLPDTHYTEFSTVKINTSEIDIHAAADSLKAQGVRVTQAAVRKLLGRASFSTIGPALKTWPGRPAEAEPVPSLLSAQGISLISSVWTAAQKIAHTAYELDQIEMEEVKKLADHLEEQLSITQSERHSLEIENRGLTEEIHLSGVKLAAAEGAAGASAAALTEVKAIVDLLTADLEHERSALINARTTAKEAGEALATVRGELAATRAELITVRGELTLARTPPIPISDAI